MNKVLIAGNLTRDPEVRVAGKNNTKVLAFSLAVNNKDKDKTTSFIDCDAFGKTAEFIGKNFVKGRQMLVEGRLKQNVWEKDGQKQSKLRVIVDDVHYIQGEKYGAAQKTEEKVEDPEPAYPF